MSLESFKGTPMGRNEALLRIKALENQAQIMGANDYEPSAFQQLLRNVQEGEIDPSDALAQAEEILNSKQDYH